MGVALGTPGLSARREGALLHACKELSIPRYHERNQRGGEAGQSRLQLGTDAPAPVPRPAAGGAAAPDPRTREGPRGQPAGPGTPGALRSGVVPAALAAPAALRLLRAGVRPDDHRPPGQVSSEPLRAVRLRAEPEPAGAGARIGQLSVPSLRLHHVLLRARLDAAAAGHGPGVLALPGAPLLPSTAPHPAPGCNGGAGGGRLLPRFLRAALGGLWEVCAVLPWHLVLLPDGSRGALAVGAELLGALRQPHAAAGARHRAVQPERHAQPLCHAPAAAGTPAPWLQGTRRAGRRREGGDPAAPGGAGSPPAASPHDGALHHVLPAFNCELSALKLQETDARWAAGEERDGWGVLGAVQEKLRPDPGGCVPAFRGSVSVPSAVLSR